MKKYHIGANAYYASDRLLKNTSLTPQNYCCNRVADIFEANV